MQQRQAATKPRQGLAGVQNRPSDAPLALHHHPNPCFSAPHASYSSRRPARLNCPPITHHSPRAAVSYSPSMPRLRTRPAPAAPLTASSVAPTASSTRPRRGTANNQSAANAVIQRSSPEETRQSIHLTVKSSPNKLRQATGGVVPKAGVSRQNIVAGKRASRNSRIVREIDSEDDDEEDEEDEAEEVDAMEVDEDEDDDIDAEGEEDEDMDADGDQDDDIIDVKSAPRTTVPTKQAIPVKPIINVTKAQDSVEAKEMAFGDDDDDELSDPDSDLDEEDAEGDDDLDAEGDDDDDIIPVADDDDEEMDSDIDLSRDQTPDVTKMTKRQRALVEEADDGGLMALSNEAQKKKHLTAEEHAMRRAEMARRRKNLSEKRNQEEKVCPSHNSSNHGKCLTKPRSKPSTASSKDQTTPSVVASLLCMNSANLPKKTKLRPSELIRFTFVTYKVRKVHNWVCRMSGCSRQ